MKIILNHSEAKPILENHFLDTMNAKEVEVEITAPSGPGSLSVEQAAKAANIVVNHLRWFPGQKIGAIKALRQWASDNKVDVLYGLVEAKNFVVGIWPD